jgi:hypothetical protein
LLGPILNLLVLRKPRSGCLEGRTTAVDALCALRRAQGEVFETAFGLLTMRTMGGGPEKVERITSSEDEKRDAGLGELLRSGRS